MNWRCANTQEELDNRNGDVALIGVEVKRSRPDFLNGIKKGQYERYHNALNGLYICTSQGIAKASEIPKKFGHLVIKDEFTSDIRCICRRHPEYHKVEYPEFTAWQIMARVYKEHVDELYRMNREYYDKLHEIGKIAEGKIFHHVQNAVMEIEKSVEINIEKEKQNNTPTESSLFD